MFLCFYDSFCQTYNGASVVDYVVILHSLLSFVVGFNVGDITEFSHHSCLYFILQIKYPQNSGDTFKLTPHIKYFIWNESQKDALREFMSLNEVENKLESLFLQHKGVSSDEATDTDILVISQKFCLIPHKKF
jgi:hypothetical protein